VGKPEPTVVELTEDLLADLMGTFASLSKVKNMLTDALAMPEKEQRKCVTKARHTIGSTIQILQAAIDDSRAIVAKAEAKPK
jgi:hypothetical protein